MNAREFRLSEAYGRARKAAKLALTITVGSPNPDKKFLLEAVQDPDVRHNAQALCKYGHVSEETWEMVAEMIQELPI